MFYMRAAQPARRLARHSRRQNAGFTVVELLMVVALMVIGFAMVSMVGVGFSKRAKADSGVKQVGEVIRAAREEAIAKRRYIKVVFDLTNTTMQVLRVDYDSTLAPVDVQEQLVGLEGGVKFVKFGTANPLAAYAPNSAVVTYTAVSSKPTIVFTPEGMAADPVSYNPTDGTIFVGRTGETSSGRAITLSGLTATQERWQLMNGTTWVSSH